MKFKFTLEKVLKQRTIQVELAQKDFLEAQSVQNQAIQQLNEMQQAIKDAIEQRLQLVQTSHSWSLTVDQINQFLLGQDLRIKNQNQRLLQIEKLVEDKREILRKALVEAKIIEKLKEKKFEEFVNSERVKEQNEIDELTVLRFSRTESLIKGSHEDGI